jgi:hypothetical protein
MGSCAPSNALKSKIGSWFEQHACRCFRLRYMVIGKFGLHREDPYAGIWNLSYTVVFRTRRSGRMKKWPGLVYFEEANDGALVPGSCAA